MIAVTSACQGCGACLLTCPERAIRPERAAIGRARALAAGVPPLAVLAARCTGCGECVEICPVDAIEFTGGPAEFAAYGDASGFDAYGVHHGVDVGDGFGRLRGRQRD